MAHGILAIISKAVFERDFAEARPGQRLAIDRYTSTNPALATLREGQPLFLVTVRPNDRLWLVAKLEKPKPNRGAWVAKPSTLVLRDVSALVSELRFTSGKGLSAKRGALGMSLQTPRELTAADAALLSKVTPALSSPEGLGQAPAQVKKRLRAIARAVQKPGLPQIGPRWSEDELVDFERRMGFTLPTGYRLYLREIGDGGAGIAVHRDFFDQCPPVTALREASAAVLARLKKPFLLKGPLEGTKARRSGAACFNGCLWLGRRSDHLDLYLVLNGRGAGEVWVDGSGIGSGLIDTETPADFLHLQQNWLLKAGVSR